MVIELERTFLIKYLPENLTSLPHKDMIDIYFPTDAKHPVLRLRKNGDKYEMTKKQPLENDPSEQTEYTIPLTKEEFEELATLKGKRIHKKRFMYKMEKYNAEIDVFLDDLSGLVLVDFEFSTIEEKNNFNIPDFCLVDVTHEESIAGGYLAGKKNSDIENFLKQYTYQKISIM